MTINVNGVDMKPHDVVRKSASEYFACYIEMQRLEILIGEDMDPDTLRERFLEIDKAERTARKRVDDLRHYVHQAVGARLSELEAG